MAQDYFDPARAVSIGGGNDDFDPGRAELIKPAGGTASDLAKSLKVGTQRLPGMVTGLADLPFALAAGARPFTKAADALGEVTGFQPGKWADETKFSAGYEQGKKAVDDAWKDGSAGDIALAYLKNPGYTANQVVESAPGMVAGGLAGRALMGVGRVAAPAVRAGGVGPAVPGLAERALGQWAAPVAAGVGEGAVTAGQQMAQYQGEDQQTNALAALGAGVGTGVLGAGMGRVANRLGLETAETAIAKAGTGVAKAADDVPLSAKRRILGGMVSEALLQELPQSAQEQMWQNWADGKPLMDGVARAATEGAIAGGVMGAGANVSDGGAGKRRALAEQQAKLLAEAEALQAQQAQDEQRAAAAQTAQDAAMARAGTLADEEGAAPIADDGGAGLQEQQAVAQRLRDQAQQASRAVPSPDDEIYQSTGADAAGASPVSAAPIRQEMDQSEPDQRPPSQRMGIDPAAGPLSKAAAVSVDSGASQEARFLAATGRDLQVRRTGPGVADESNVIDVQGRVVDERAIPTPRRLTAQDGARESGAIAFQDGVPRSEIAAIPNIVARAEQLRGYDEAAQKAAQPLALPAPSNLREGLERIRAQREQAARTAQVPPTTGATSVPQANQAQQGSAQPTQTGGPQAGAATATASTSPAGGNRVQAAGLTDGAPTQNPGAQAATAAGAQGQAPQTAVARPDGWRKSMLKAGPVAKAMGIDPKGKRLAQVVAEIDAADAQRAGVRQDGADLSSGQIDRSQPGSTAQVMRSLAQQFRDRHAVTQQDTDRTFAGVLEQFANEVEEGKRTPQSVQQAIARYQELAAQPVPATHADPGEKAEAATSAVVTDSLKTAARNEDTKPSEMRKWLVAEIDRAMLDAPEKDATEFVSFDVPGDGVFKVQKSRERLLEFRKKVMASPGFKDGGQKQAKPQQNDSILNGGGTTETIRAFLADGDVQGAVEFAKLKGVEFTPVEPRASITANGKFKRVPASVKSSVPSVAEALTQVEAEQLNQYLTAESARKEPAAAQDADVQPSPQDFIPAPDGGLDYGEITPEMGKAMRRQAGKIRLQHGVQNSNGTGWGLVHIEANHGKQISGLGFGSVQDFVAHVASSIQQVWQVPGNSQLLLTLKDGRKDVMYIQLEIAKEGDFYRVNSAFPVRQEDYESLKGMKKIWDGSEPTSAVTGQRPAFATAASASPESESSQGSSNARGQDASVPPTTPAAQPITRADVTAAQQQAAAMIAERIDVMTAGEVNTIARRFLPTMGVKPTISKERNKAAVTDFTKVNPMAAADEFGVTLPADVRRALDAEMQGKVAEGYVARGAAEPANDRNAFTLQRLNRDTDQMEPVTFERGEYVRYTVGGKDQFGDIDGISQARKEFSVDGLWYPFGFAYKAERPAAPKADTVPLSSVIDKMNAKNGQGLTDADRVPEQKPASKTPTVDRHNDAMAAVREGKATAEQFRASFEQVTDGKAAIVAELDTMTKAQLLRDGGPFVQMRYANEKKAVVVDAVYREMVGEYALGESVTYSMGKGAYESAVRKMVEATDADKLANYVAERKAAMEEMQSRRAAKAAAIEDPKTLGDFREVLNTKIREGMTRKEAFLTLTPKQRIQYDTLEAESTREARENRKRAQKTEMRAAGQTTAGEIVATKHTRDGYDLFVVKLADRLSKEDYSTVLASAKKLGGWYSAFRGNGAIPGFQFKDKANAEAFLALAGGDTAAAQEQVAKRRDAFEDDRSQTAAERLRAMADKLEEGAAEVEGQERKTNTARRARFASAAMASAAADKAKAKTMRNIAQAIEDGDAKFLDAVRTKSQVDMLTGIVDTAKGNELRAKYPSYADQEKRKGEPPTAETADFAEFPSYSAFRSDLATLGRQMLEVDGTKKLGQRLMSVADDVTDAYLEFAKANFQDVSRFGRGDSLADFASKDEAERAIKRSGLTGKAIVLPIKRGQNRVILSPSEAIGRGLWQGDGDKRITLTAEFGAELVEAIGRRGNKQNKLSVPWQFQNAYDRRKALSRIGIETPSEFRAAVREFISLKEQAIANRTRELELQMVGRKADGLDFFPTSAEVADQMIEAADLTPDMAVLEPSAGMGHLADRIREAGAEPDVIEISADRRALLEEKGYTTQAVDDFLDLKPREFYTFGDTFRAPDGAEGIMRGANGNRVKLVNQAGDMVGAGYYDRADLTGVAHNGTASGYDRIIMNPPFSNRRDAEHVRHAYSLLKPGGRIVAIMGEGVFFGQDKKAQDFREWLESVGGTSEKLPEGSFMDPSLPVNTSVNARMVVIDKADGVAMFSRATDSVPQSVAEWLPDTVIADEVEKRIGGFAQQPPVRIRDTAFGQLPGVARNDNVAGAVHDGAIYLFRDQLGDRAAVQRTLFHELFHYGLRKFLTKEQFTGQMMNLYRRDRAIKEEADRWAATADGLRAKEFGGSEYALARGVDEALAILAEPNGGPHLNQTARAMFVRRVTNWLADVAQFLKMDKAAAYLRSLHNSEARAYIQSVFKRLETDAGGNTLNWSETSEPAFSRAVSPSPPAAWDAPTPTGFDDVIYKLQDKNIDLKRVVESISKATGKVADSINAYLKEELFHKRAAKRVADFGDRELKPLMNKMRLAGLSMEDVEEYLHARHAKEANAVIAQRNPGNAGLQDGGSGMTNAAADNYFAKLDPAQRRKLEAVAKSVDAIIDGTRKLYVSYGLEDQAVVDGWANMYQHYIPLMREDKDGGMGTGQGFSVKGKETKGRTGSTRKVVDILANVAMQREKLIVRGEKNIVAKALVGLAQANPNPDFWEVRSQAPTERVFDPKTGVVVDRPDPLFKSRENVAVAKVKDANGKVTEQMVVFNEDNPRAVRMAAAMKNLDAGNLEGLLGVSAKITRYFAAINTQYNPVFGVVNLVRDVQGAMVNLGTTPLAGQQGKIAKDTLSALRGIYSDIRKTRKGGQATSQWSQLWEQMQDDGGTTGYRDLFKTSADRANDLKSILNPEGWMDSKWGKFFTADGRLKVPLSMAQKGATEIFGWLSDYNEAMENGVRLAAYKAALDKGMSREQAASIAKNLTVNFNRKGQAGMQAGAVYAFFNAAMQGTARIGQTLFDMDGGDLSTLRLSKTGKAVVYGGVMLGVMQALALSAAGFDDDDPPEFVRERSLIIPTGDKTYVSIPMPLGLHVIPGIGRNATEFALSGFDKPAKRAVSMVGMFADAFNPIGNAGLSMQTIAPTALDPLVALSENKDWTGKPIARVSSNKAMPGHTQWKDTATGFSKVVAEAINWISGGNEYVAGAFSPTPDQIDYLLAQVGGGVAREAAKVQQTITTAMSGETLPTHKIPLVGRFVGNAASQASQGSAFYANLNKLNELETEIKGLRKDGRFDEAAKLARENPQSMMIAMANRAERDVQRLRREKRELIANDASREQVRAKEEQITAVMTRLNEAVERRKAQAAR